MMKLRSWLEDRSDEILSLLKQLVELESPSDVPEATEAIIHFLTDILGELGFACTLHQNEGAGPHLVATRGDGSGGVLALSHVDTVWPQGEVARRPFRIEADRALGPGISDMKGGIAQLIYAVKAIDALGLEPTSPLTLLFNTDEEMGSATSRGLIEDRARQSAHVLVLEPPIGEEGLIKTFRKGVGGFQVRAQGLATHAGAEHRRGVNAIEELAHQTIKLQGMTDYGRGTTVNVGIVAGGSRINVVPAEATARIDVRVSSLVEAERVQRAILGLRPYLDGADLEITGGLNRPPMERTPAIAALFERARGIAAQLGIELQEGGTGGASDGNFTAALGIPTLDGLGAVGGGGHALDEHVKLEHLAPRAALVAGLLVSL